MTAAWVEELRAENRELRRLWSEAEGRIVRLEAELAARTCACGHRSDSAGRVAFTHGNVRPAPFGAEKASRAFGGDAA